MRLCLHACSTVHHNTPPAPLAAAAGPTKMFLLVHGPAAQQPPPGFMPKRGFKINLRRAFQVWGAPCRALWLSPKLALGNPLRSLARRRHTRAEKGHQYALLLYTGPLFKGMPHPPLRALLADGHHYQLPASAGAGAQQLHSRSAAHSSQPAACELAEGPGGRLGAGTGAAGGKHVQAAACRLECRA